MKPLAEIPDELLEGVVDSAEDRLEWCAVTGGSHGLGRLTNPDVL